MIVVTLLQTRTGHWAQCRCHRTDWKKWKWNLAMAILGGGSEKQLGHFTCNHPTLWLLAEVLMDTSNWILNWAVIAAYRMKWLAVMHCHWHYSNHHYHCWWRGHFHYYHLPYSLGGHRPNVVGSVVFPRVAIWPVDLRTKPESDNRRGIKWWIFWISFHVELLEFSGWFWLFLTDGVRSSQFLRNVQCPIFFMICALTEFMIFMPDNEL